MPLSHHRMGSNPDKSGERSPSDQWDKPKIRKEAFVLFLLEVMEAYLGE